MRRGAVAVVAVVLGAVVAAGCGEESGADSGPGSGTGTPSGGGSPSTAEEYAEATRKEHDRAWPDVARECRDVRPEPSEAVGDGGEGAVPENPKYGENNAYKQTTDVTPDELCRGEAHAVRIAAALKDAAPADLKDEERIRRLFEDLGYTGDTVSARQNDGGLVWWDVLVAGAGPCISGNTDPAAEIDVHGVYMEGGCTEPAGGH